MVSQGLKYIPNLRRKDALNPSSCRFCEFADFIASSAPYNVQPSTATVTEKVHQFRGRNLLPLAFYS